MSSDNDHFHVHLLLVIVLSDVKIYSSSAVYPYKGSSVMLRSDSVTLPYLKLEPVTFGSRHTSKPTLLARQPHACPGSQIDQGTQVSQMFQRHACPDMSLDFVSRDFGICMRMHLQPACLEFSKFRWAHTVTISVSIFLLSFWVRWKSNPVP